MVEHSSERRVVRSRETVRVVIEDPEEHVLLLHKSSRSARAAGLWEFPGGGIDKIDQASSPDKTIKNAAIREVKEETEIDLSTAKVEIADTFGYTFRATRKGKGAGSLENRTVYTLYTRLDTQPPVKINPDSTDMHDESKWVSKPELDAMKKDGQLSGNSRNYKTVFEFAKSKNR